jgi:hypothetical protein
MTDTISDSSKRKPPDAPEPTDRDQIDSDQIDSDRMDREWLTSLLRPLLVVVMVSSIDIVLFAFLRQYAPDIAPATRWSIVGMGILAAIVGCATTTWLALPAQRLRRSAGYRLAEILLLAAATRALLWLADGVLPSPLAMLNDPTGVFANGAFLFALVVVLFTWYAATDFTDDLTRMALQPDELWINRRANVRFADSARPAPTNRTQILRGFVARWVGWGIVLILIASTLRLGIARPNFWALGRLDIDPVVVGAVLIYFLVGLLLISQGQLAVLRARWTLDRLPSAQAITRNWPLYTLLVILLFAVVAAFLPLGDTYLLSVILATILNALFGLIYLLFRLITVAFLMLLSLLPFASPPPEEAPPPPPAQSMLEAPPEMLAVPPWVGGAFFWLSVALLLGYAAYFYFSDKETSLRWLRRLWAYLVAQWQSLFGAAWRWYVQRQPTMTGKGDSPHTLLPAFMRRFLPWRLLSPNQRVRQLYFQLLAAAEARAIGRRPAETPDRFAPRLETAIEAAAEEAAAIDSLTASFVDVRYAGRSASDADSERLKQHWQHLRVVLAPKAEEKP